MDNIINKSNALEDEMAQPPDDELSLPTRSIFTEEIETTFKGDKDLALFTVTWLANGLNATKAYKELHPDVSLASATVQGSRLLRKVNISMILDCYGLNLELYLKVLAKGLGATKWNNETKKEEADYKTRKMYHEVLGQLLGIEKGKGRDVNAQNYNQHNNYYYANADELEADMRRAMEEEEKLAEKSTNNEINPKNELDQIPQEQLRE